MRFPDSATGFHRLSWGQFCWESGWINLKNRCLCWENWCLCWAKRFESSVESFGLEGRRFSCLFVVSSVNDLGLSFCSIAPGFKCLFWVFRCRVWANQVGQSVYGFSVWQLKDHYLGFDWKESIKWSVDAVDSAFTFQYPTHSQFQSTLS